MEKVWIAKTHSLGNLYKKIKFSFPTKENLMKKSLLSKNKILKDSFFGEKCFIVANGPSINEENLELLKDKYVFTVNQMIRKKEFRELNSICNFWIDPAYFDEKMPNEVKEEFEILFKETCLVNNKIVNFVPVSAYSFMKRHGLLLERVQFVDLSLNYYDGYNKDFDLSHLMPCFHNIVQYAISMAIYMGFKEIYLLGCDSTGIITKINSVLNEDIEGCYTYDLGQKGQKYVNSLLNYFTIEEQFAGWTRIFHLYRELNDYCVRRDIKLINCSKRTIIETIPRLPLEKVI